MLDVGHVPSPTLLHAAIFLPRESLSGKSGKGASQSRFGVTPETP